MTAVPRRTQWQPRARANGSIGYVFRSQRIRGLANYINTNLLTYLLTPSDFCGIISLLWWTL